MDKNMAERIVDALGEAGVIADHIVTTPARFDAAVEVVLREANKELVDVSARFKPTLDAPYNIVDSQGRRYSAYSERDANYVRDTVGGTIERTG